LSPSEGKQQAKRPQARPFLRVSSYGHTIVAMTDAIGGKKVFADSHATFTSFAYHHSPGSPYGKDLFKVMFHSQAGSTGKGHLNISTLVNGAIVQQADQTFHVHTSAHDVQGLVELALINDLMRVSFVGGDLVMSKAHEEWKDGLNVNDPQVSEWHALMQVAGDYRNYLDNTIEINALIKASPASAFAVGWMTTLMQVDSLGLNQNYTSNGTSGNDTILAADGNDVLYGGAGHDTLKGYGGHDHLMGEDGDDTLDVGTSSGIGLDIAQGGAGNDTYLYYAANAQTDFADVADGSTADKIVLTDLTLEEVNVLVNDYNLVYFLHDFGGTEHYLRVTYRDTFDIFQFSDGRIIHDFSKTADTGGSLTGDGGHNYLVGSAYDDTLNGGAGDDWLDVGQGSGTGLDIAYDSAGDDTFVYRASVAQADFADTINDGGQDRILFEDLTLDGVEIVITANLVYMLHDVNGTQHYLRVTNRDGFGTYEFADGQIINHFNTTSGGTLIGTSGQDYLLGSSGVDRLEGQAGDDTILGGAGNDELFGQGGNDVLLGGDGADMLHAHGGNDWLDVGGSNGWQAAFGHGGDDTYVYKAIYQNVMFAEFDTTLTNNDRVIFEDLTLDALNIASENGNLNHVVFTHSYGASTHELTVLDAHQIEHFQFADGTVIHDFQIVASTGGTLVDGLKNDYLQGSNQDDIFVMDEGQNWITTGAGSDVIDLSVFNSITTVTDFDPLDDVLHFSSSTFADASTALAAAYDDGTDTTLQLGDDMLILEGVLASQLSTNDFHIV
jgi:Ca2+-binding RTX toxin-like protein